MRTAVQVTARDPRDNIKATLLEAEGSGRVDYKRSVLWPSENGCAKVQQLLMRLANANVGTGGYIELGREDDGARLGLVDAQWQPITERQLAAAEQTIVAHAQRLDPPMQVRWHHLPWDDGKETIAIEVSGRARGEWYQGEDGITWTGSASHPQKAKQRLLKQWAMEEVSIIQERRRHEDLRPIFSASVEWERGFTTDDGQQFGITVIVDVSLVVEQLATHIQAALLTNEEQGSIWLELTNPTVMSPTERTIDGGIVPSRFVLRDPVFQPGQQYYLVLWAKDALGWEWRQMSDKPLEVMKPGRVLMALPELSDPTL
jgi:hypothetical protein